MAEWSTAFVNDLPDSSFLFIEGGGEKDEEGKTKPRSLRHLPWKDASGKVDEAHAHNALSRIPQTDGLSADKKQALQDKVRRALGIDTEKNMSTIKETLTKIENLLGATVGVAKSVEFTPAEFVAYAHDQIVKAASDEPAISTKRLKSLLGAVSVFKDNYVDGESESVKVPITWPDTTAMEEKQNQLIDPAKPVSAPDQSAFAQGFIAKTLGPLQELVKALKAEAEPESDEEKAKKAAAKAAEEEEDKKAKKALEDAGLPDVAKRLFEKRKAGDVEEGASAAGASAAEPPDGTPAKKPAAKADVAKNAPDVDGTIWPDDLAAPTVDKDGKAINKSLDWGTDKAPAK